MSGRLLDFSQYLGGADNVKVIELFPRSQKTYTYNFNANVTSWTFTSDYQTILLDQVTYDRVTGLPNFTDTIVLGYFTGVSNVSANMISVSNATTGTVNLTIPASRYSGKIYPNARQYVVMTVLSMQWDTNSTPPQKDMHRWAIIERWEPGVTPGDPRTEATYTVLT